MDFVLAKGKEFLSSQMEDKKGSNRPEKTKRLDDDVDDSDDRPFGGRSGGKSGAGIGDGKKTAGAKKPEHQQPTNSELMASAKLLASVAQSKLGGDGDGKAKEELDTGKLAGAAADVLAAASHYGKIGDEGMGKYIGQAEDYLHGYELKNSKPKKTAGTDSGSQKSTSSTAAGKSSLESRQRSNSRNDNDDYYGENVKKEKKMPSKKQSPDSNREEGDDDDGARGRDERMPRGGNGMPKKQSNDYEGSREDDGEADGMRKKKCEGRSREHNSDEDDDGYGGGYDVYNKKPQGKLKNKDDDDRSPRGEDQDAGGEMGGIMKVAQGFFK